MHALTQGTVAVNVQEATERFRESDTLFREGRYHEALVYLEELDHLFPNSKNVLYPKAMCMDRLGRIPEALALCDQLIAQFQDPRAQALKERLVYAGDPIPTNIVTPGDASAPTQKMKRRESPEAKTEKVRRMVSMAVLVGLVIVLAAILAGKLLGMF